MGLALGLGGASIGDLLVLSRRRSGFPRELIGELGRVIWAGLALLTLSGIGLFLLNPSKYLHSSGFLAKMVVVGALILNGIWLSSIGTRSLGRWSLLSGSLSTCSWYGSLGIAVFKNQLDWGVWTYLGIYGAAVLLFWLCLMIFFRQGISCSPMLNQQEGLVQDQG